MSQKAQKGTTDTQAASNTKWFEMSKEDRNKEIEKIFNKYAENDIQSSNDIFEKNNQTESNFISSSIDMNALSDKTPEEIEIYFEEAYCGKSSADNNETGGIITSPITYLHNTVGKSTDTYTVSKNVICSGVSKAKMSSLRSDENNCTLTALYNIMNYYKYQGYTKIPSNNSTLYNIIETQAEKLGYTPSSGLGVTKSNNLVKNTWQNGFGYSSGNGANNYLWNSSTLKSAINNDRPYLFSLASGQYYNHTIAVFGYITYKNNRTGDTYTFLKIADGWSNSTRYLSLNESYIGCQTTITPPTNK